MKKVPSYPKITTKTNITFLHTQNININSPKNLAVSTTNLNAKKMFKSSSSKQNRQKSNNSTIKITNEKSKPKIMSHKEKANDNKNESLSQNIKIHKKNQYFDTKQKQSTHHGEQKGQIKRLQDKLKFLQKKIDTLKTSKSKKQIASSQRSKSRVLITSPIINKSSVEQFQKKSMNKDSSSKNLLKKSHSDKNVLKSRPPKVPSKNYQNGNRPSSPSNKLKEKKYENELETEQVIQKFVTQVKKNQNMVQKHEVLNCSQQQKKRLYYISKLLKSLLDSNLMIYKQHLHQSLQTLSFLKKTSKPTLKQLQPHYLNLPPLKKHKITIVLDLDQTLIHCNQTLQTTYDVCLGIKFPTGEKIDAGLNIRPFATQFLKALAQICQLVVFTASHQCYANVVLDYLDPQHKFISHRLYRNHCWQTQEAIYIKDLRVLKNRDLQNILLVDNAAYSYFYQLENGIPIIPFYDDKQDQELIMLFEYLKMLIKFKQTHSTHNTLQKANNHYFKLTEYNHFKDVQMLAKRLYQPALMQFQQFCQ